MAEVDDIREELAQARKELESLKPSADNTPNRVQMTSADIVKLVVACPVVFVWLFLGSRIIISATTSQQVLSNGEPLVMVLSILTIPVTGILQNLFAVGGDK